MAAGRLQRHPNIEISGEGEGREEYRPKPRAAQQSVGRPLLWNRSPLMYLAVYDWDTSALSQRAPECQRYLGKYAASDVAS